MDKDNMESKKSSKNVIWGVVCLCGPFLLLIITLSSYAIASFTANLSGTTTADFLNVFKLILGLLGIVSVLGIIVGIPLGIVLLVKGSKK